MCIDPGSKFATEAPHDCSKLKDPKFPAEDLAEHWGIGQPNSPREARPRPAVRKEMQTSPGAGESPM